jgi:uncharacterized protein YqjF (DUF2071 family)
MPPARRRPLLSADWRYLVMLNYDVDPHLLEPLVPAGTVLDRWRGRTLVSIVGFRFADTRVLGATVPLHRDFEEVNLRFYVRRHLSSGAVRRGVVFVRELVPRLAVALAARWAYHEPYRAVPMRSTAPASRVDAPGRIMYEWRTGERWHRLAATAVGAPLLPAAASEAAFMTEHYWGYTRQRDESTREYEVAHPGWRVWAAADPVLDADVVEVYGAALARALSGPPASALIAEGSPVLVHAPRRLTQDGSSDRDVTSRDVAHKEMR